MNKVGTRTPKWDKNGNKMGTNGNKNPKVNQEWEQEKWEQSGNKNWQEWEQSGNKNSKVDKNGNKVEQSGNKNSKVGQEWEHSGNKVGTK